MKTRIVLAGLLATMMVLEASAQRAEIDDMYFRGKDREKNKSIEAEAAYASAKQNQKAEEAVTEEVDNANPTDSYSARNVNPEYVSRSNSEQASEDESNYYLEGYTRSSTDTNNSYYNNNNSYYNNTNWARNSYYANSVWNSPYYGYGYSNSLYSSYGSYGYYDPWMTSSYGWSSGWSISLTYGNYYSPWGYGYSYPYYYYYYGYGYSYPNYYYGGNYYNYESSASRVNYGKRPSRHSAVVTPTERTVSGSRTGDNTTTVTGRTRTAQTQDDYYVKPARRTSTFNSGTTPSSNTSRFSTPSTTQQNRTRNLFSQPSQTQTPSYAPSPSRSSSGGSSGGRSSGGGDGGGSRPRGRG